MGVPASILARAQAALAQQLELVRGIVAAVSSDFHVAGEPGGDAYDLTSDPGTVIVNAFESYRLSYDHSSWTA